MSGQEVSDWIEHDGSGMPVGDDVLVQVRFRGLEHKETRVIPAHWYSEFWGSDEIQFYRVVKSAS
ncbi:hypothetical protein V6R85_01335 [Agrobacterium sp. CCNWLW32]|uniref:hypothetical protein n=1 Tax=Agrobacterium sp. CCNWLW32 TaxID=3122072 RepID=UPI0030101B98